MSRSSQRSGHSQRRRGAPSSRFRSGPPRAAVNRNEGGDAILTDTYMRAVTERVRDAPAEDGGVSSDSSDDFLLSGAEKIEKAKRKAAKKEHQTNGRGSDEQDESSNKPTPKVIPGYFFDAARNKYFKILPSHVHTAAAGRDADDAVADESHDTSSGGGGGGVSMHSLLSQSSRKKLTRSLSALSVDDAAGAGGRRETKRIRLHNHHHATTANTHASQSKMSSPLHSFHVRAAGRSILQALQTRSLFPSSAYLTFRHDSPSSIMSAAAVGMLRPTGFPILHAALDDTMQYFTPFTPTTISSEFDIHPTSDHAPITYEPTTRILSVCGSKLKQARDASAPHLRSVYGRTFLQSTGEGCFHCSFLLHPVDTIRDRQRYVHPDDRLHSLPFRSQLISAFDAPSPVTSLHRFPRWSLGRHPEWMSRTTTLIYDEVRRVRAREAERNRLQRVARGDIWEGESYSPTSDKEPVRHILAYTTLGNSASPGQFHVRMEDHYPTPAPSPVASLDGARIAAPPSIFTHSLSRGSVWSSAFPCSAARGTTVGIKVALGCTKGGIVLDLLTGARTYTFHTNKSDILSQIWLDETNIVLNGSRDGTIRTNDTRIHSSSATGEAIIQMTSSVGWMKQLASNTNHIMAASVGGEVNQTGDNAL